MDFIIKATKEIENLHDKIGPNKEIVETYIIHQLQLQSKWAKYHRNMNKELKKFYIKNKNTLCLYAPLNGEPQEYDTQLNKCSYSLFKKIKKIEKLLSNGLSKRLKRKMQKSCWWEIIWQCFQYLWRFWEIIWQWWLVIWHCGVTSVNTKCYAMTKRDNFAIKKFICRVC